MEGGIGVLVLSSLLGLVTTIVWITAILFVVLLIVSLILANSSEDFDFDITYKGIVILFIYKRENIGKRGIGYTSVSFFRPVEYIEDLKNKIENKK